MRFALVVSLALLVAGAAVAQTRPRRPPARPAPGASASLQQDEKAISDLQERDIAANLALNVDNLMTLRTDDVVYLVPGAAPLVGGQAVRGYYEQMAKQLANFDILAYEENWQEVRLMGDYAYQWGTVFRRVKPPVGEKETVTSDKMVRILVRQPDGGWKISRVIWNSAPEGGQ